MIGSPKPKISSFKILQLFLEGRAFLFCRCSFSFSCSFLFALSEFLASLRVCACSSRNTLTVNCKGISGNRTQRKRRRIKERPLRLAANVLRCIPQTEEQGTQKGRTERGKTQNVDTWKKRGSRGEPMAEGISIFFFLPCSNLQGKWSGDFGQTNAGGGARNGSIKIFKNCCSFYWVMIVYT